MAAIAWSDVLNLPGAAADLGTVAVGGQTMLLNVVNAMLDVSMFDGETGPRTKLARCALAAHFGALGRLGISGPLLAEGDGRLSRQYAIPSGRSEYMVTSYGRLYWQLIGAQAFGPRLL